MSMVIKPLWDVEEDASIQVVRPLIRVNPWSTLNLIHPEWVESQKEMERMSLVIANVMFANVMFANVMFANVMFANVMFANVMFANVCARVRVCPDVIPSTLSVYHTGPSTSSIKS
jgi:hypothetical protein